jgi:hypothetical protein
MEEASACRPFILVGADLAAVVAIARRRNLQGVLDGATPPLAAPFALLFAERHVRPSGQQHGAEQRSRRGAARTFRRDDLGQPVELGAVHGLLLLGRDRRTTSRTNVRLQPRQGVPSRPRRSSEQSVYRHWPQ